MPLPNPRTAWPPVTDKKYANDLRQWAAWYSGEPALLHEAAMKAPKSPVERMKFWFRQGNDQQPSTRNRMHVPLAAQIARKSAKLIFGEPAAYTAPTGEGISTDATQARIDELSDAIGFDQVCPEAAEVSAALGGVYLRPVWDEEVAGHPFVTIARPDQAVGEFKFGRLQSVTFHEVVNREGRHVWRHLERHEPGLIEHGLFVGDDKALGERVALETHPDTLGLPSELVLPDALSDRLLPVYVPNVPDRRRRVSAEGSADIAGSEDLLDALDEAWSQWVRSLRLSQPRILVPDDFLEQRGGGRGASFDLDQDVFVKLSVEPTAEGRTITTYNPDLDVARYADTVTNLKSTIVAAAGYSPETFGIHEAGPADSGRALTIRQGDTWQTKHAKERAFDGPLGELWWTLLAIDRHVFGGSGSVEPVVPGVRFADAIIDDPKEEAERLELLQRAQAMSTRQRVKLAQPHLEGKDLDDEVEAIKAESGAMVGDPSGGFPV